MTIHLRKSNAIKISLEDHQWKQISAPQRIKSGCQEENVIAFDIYDDQYLIGFAMVKQFAKDSWFLWNFAIDRNFQGKKLGFESLKILIDIMKTHYQAKIITTTYTYGNEIAKGLYEKIGFVETDRVEEADCHEVNLMISL